MQNAQAILSHHSNSRPAEGVGFGRVLARWLARLFGCWHTELSRPFTLRGVTARVCLDCGARRRFDTAKWEMVGAYYYDTPSVVGDLYTIEKRARVTGRRGGAGLRLAA
ncbi:MAG TPA: hypothetical protein VF544_24235 [Pyrinomonadaceae bacterium]|jgi:hypothetical protein